MVIVDTALRKRAEEGRPIRVGLIGAGAMARGVANQIVHYVPAMELAAIANRTPDHAMHALNEYRGVGRVSGSQGGVRGGLGRWCRTEGAFLAAGPADVRLASCRYVDLLGYRTWWSGTQRLTVIGNRKWWGS